MKKILITGATGLLGKRILSHFVARGHDLHVLVRSGSLPKHASLLEAWAGQVTQKGGSLTIHVGDIAQAHLGLPDDFMIDGLTDVFHLAALYDLKAHHDVLTLCNVQGTQNLLDWLKRSEFSGLFHHMSSVAVAGDYGGIFHEQDLDVGQNHPHPYQATKFEAERKVRDAKGLRYRIYRPSAIVGHSLTGEMDRIDGPYYLFKPIRRLRDALPRWVPLFSNRKTKINMLPVDYVARVIDHIAHRDDCDGQTFHVVDPKPLNFRDTFNVIADAAGAPRIQGRGLGRFIPRGMLDGLASFQFFQDLLLEENGIPKELMTALNRKVKYNTSQLDAALKDSGLRCPRPSEYVPFLWDYWLRHLDIDRSPAVRNRQFFEDKTVLITGSSSGVGASLALQCAEAGAKVLLVARRQEELHQVAVQARALGAEAETYVADLTQQDAIDALVADVIEKHGTPDVLVNNAAHSIRRTVSESLERYHDYERVMRLNFFAPIRLMRGFIPGMQERKSGHVVNVLTAGVAMATPRFSAYGASKAALSHLTDTMAVELLEDNIHFSGIYLPWVRTPMMDATGHYKDTDALTPEEAASWITEAITLRKQRVLNYHTQRRWVLNALFPSYLTRTLNLFLRIYQDDDNAYPEFDMERTILKRFVKGKQI